ncbi:MAG: purine permease [Thermanaerothrix sp.]|nr:purine permease [Thermanaerothrix sp.]
MSDHEESAVLDRELIYQLHGRPSLGVALPLGLQHVLAMFTGNLAPIFVVAGVIALPKPDMIVMIQGAMIISGITTLIQLYPIGKRNWVLPRIGGELPIVMGTSFAFVPTSLTVGQMYGISGILGGALLGSLVEFVMGIFIKPLKRFFPPLVVGSVLIAMGTKLLGVGVNYFAGGIGSKDYGSPKNLLLGTLVLATVLLLQRFGKGMAKVSSLLIAIVIGYVAAVFMGMVDFSPVANAGWISIPKPFHFGMTFHLDAVLAFAAVYIVSGLETIGNTSGITIAAFNREATTEETSGAIMGDSFGSAIAAVFNTLPNTAFGQNAGLVAMTKVVNKWCIATGAMVLILAGLFPKVGAVISVMPNSVLGGAVVTVFAMIMLNGIKMLAKSGFSDRNMLVLGITFGIGMGFSSVPALLEHLPKLLQFLFRDTVSSVCIISILANIIFPDSDEGEKKFVIEVEE